MLYPPLAQMVGQLFMFGFKGDQITPEHPIYSDIALRNLGGVILFDRHLSTKSATNNIIGKEQLCQLTKDLQNIREEKLLIAVDQEGGKVNRFREEFGFHLFPQAFDLGDQKNLDQTTTTAQKLSKMLRDCGINFNLAPVADVNSNPENPIIGKVGRSFSCNPKEVAQNCGAWIKAHNKNGILSCLKHFPGHGSSINDSHLGFVDISRSWHSDELIPFQQLIDEQLADAIMVGHLFHNHFDPALPTSLSTSTISYLRKRMNFTGVIITDDMQMRAITDKYTLSDACIMALQAGVNIIIIGNNLDYDPDLFLRIHRGVLQAVDSGKLRQAQIEGSWKRVQTLKSLI